MLKNNVASIRDNLKIDNRYLISLTEPIDELLVEFYNFMRQRERNFNLKHYGSIKFDYYELKKNTEEYLKIVFEENNNESF